MRQATAQPRGRVSSHHDLSTQHNPVRASFSRHCYLARTCFSSSTAVLKRTLTLAAVTLTGAAFLRSNLSSTALPTALRRGYRLSCGGSAEHSGLSSGMSTDGATQTNVGLKALWADAYDAWRNIPGHTEKVVCLMPEPTQAVTADIVYPKLPGAVQGEVVLFGLTSWNPLGQPATAEQNLRSYREILCDLRALKPNAMWQSYGFDRSGYRENGLTVAFDSRDGARAREAVVGVARKYGQGAVYEFTPTPGDPTRITRRTVPALIADVDADTVMVACELPTELPEANPDLHFEFDL